MTDEEFRALFDDARQHADEKFAEVWRHVDEKTAELRHHFDVTVERWETRFQTFTEWVVTKDELHASERKTGKKDR